MSLSDGEVCRFSFRSHHRRQQAVFESVKSVSGRRCHRQGTGTDTSEPARRGAVDRNENDLGVSAKGERETTRNCYEFHCPLPYP